MALQDKGTSNLPGEHLVAWQEYKAFNDEELDLQEGDVVELLDIHDPVSSAKRMKLDPELDQVSGQLLDSSAARHKLSVRPRRSHASSRHSPTRLNINDRWLVRQIGGAKKQGWVPCRVLQTADDPTLAKTGLPGDAEYRRQAVVKELVETEQEFVRDLDYVVQNYLIPSESGKTPKIIKDNFDVLFGNLKEIAEFHRTVLMDGVKYYAKEPALLGKAFLRLERDFDNHVNYCKDEHLAQEFLDVNDDAYDYFSELSQRLGDDKSIAEHLKLPIQRINDYQLLLKELVRYSACLGENNTDLQKALELMQSVPHRAQDDKFIQSIEGYKGSIHKLGRLLAHDRFSVTFADVTKERYLFLFKARILICKVRRIADDRSIFQLKDIIRLPQVELKDHPDTTNVFELVDKKGGQALVLKAHRDQIKKFWLQEIREFAKDFGESEGTTSDEFQLASPPAESLSPDLEPLPAFSTPQKQSAEDKSLVKSQPPPKPARHDLEEKALKNKGKDPEPSSPSKKVKLSEDSKIPIKVSPPKEKLKKDEQKASPPKEETKLIGVKKTKQQDNLISELKSAVKKTKEEVSTKSNSKQITEQTIKSESVATASEVYQEKKTVQGKSITLKENVEKKVLLKESDKQSKETTATSETLKVDKKAKEKTTVESTKAFTLGSTSTTTDLHQSNTLSNILTPESETVPPDFHLNRIEALEPLYHIVNPAKEPPSISEEKTLVQETTQEESKTLIGASDTVLTDYKIGVEFNVEVQDDMSRRYTSSRDEGGRESSYSSRRSASSYDPDRGYSSSRYSTETSSRYSTADPIGNSKYDSLGSSKYESLSSKYDPSKYDSLKESLGESGSKYSSSRYDKSDDASALTSSYSRKPLTESNETEYSYSKRSPRSSALDDDTGSSYSSRRLKAKGDDDYTSSYSRRSKLDDDDGDITSSYSKRQSRTTTSSSGGEKDGEKYYSKRTIKGSLDLEGEGDSYSVRRSIKGSLEGTGIEPSEKTDDYSYTTKRSLGSELGSKYSRRSVSAEGSEGESRYSRRALNDDTDELINKYSKKYIRGESTEKRGLPEEEEDKYAKYSRKYSRTESTEPKDEERSYSRRYSKRTESIERKNADPEDDPYEKYARKYLRKGEESSEVSTGKKKLSEEEEEDAYLKYREKHSRAEASEERIRIGDASSAKSTETSAINGKYQSAESFETSQTKKESYATNSKTESSQSETKETRSSSNESRAQVESSSKTSESLSTTMKTTREKSAEQKLEEVTDSDHRPHFIKTIRGTSIELTTEERAERTKTDHPEFLVSMKDAELLEGTYLRFMVKVVGEPNPDIAFFKDGKKITEAHELIQVITEHSDKGFYELVIPEVKKSDAGEYKCVATNKFGEASSEAKVTVTDDKEIFKQMPEGEILPPGEKPEFNWKKDGVNFEPDERFKVLLGDDEDSLALVFQHVKPDDVGLYTCVAQTSRGHISCSAELTVHGTVNQLFREPEKPKLIIEKREPIVTAGNQAMLELQVKGYPKPQVKWTHDGKTIESSSKYKILYEDEESMSLIIKDVQSADAGTYTVIAENECGSDSAEMKLTVKAPPKIKNKMEDIKIHADQLLKMTCEIEGIPEPKVQFYRDGKEIKQSERLKIVREGEKYSLVIEKTSLKDTGSYSVVAMNELAQVSQFWKLDVYSKPKVVQKLGTNKVVAQGENLELKLKIESEPKPEVKWYKDEEEIQSSEHFVIKENGDEYILRITGAVTTDASKYKFKAVNIHGTGEDEARVDVKKMPKITKGLENMTVTEHDANVTLDIQLEAFPKPTVKWYLDEIEIKETRSEFTRIESDNGVKLVIKEVSSELSGQYTCKLSNECGEAETSAKLTVNCAPRIIKHLKDTTVEEGATLHLEVEVGGCPPPTVKWLRNGREVSADARIKISRDTHRNETYNLAVSLIKYEEQGEYEVIVTNQLGTVTSKSFVTVHKVTHTDAIEETEEPPEVFKLDKPKKEETPEPEEPEELKGIKTKIDLQQATVKKTPEPLIEEPSSPILTKRGTHAILEEMEYVEDSGENYESKSAKPQEITRKTSRRAKTVEIVEIETVSVDSDKDVQKKSEIIEINSGKKVKRAISATKQTVEEFESTENINKFGEVTEVEIDAKSKQALSAIKTEVKKVDVSDEQSKKPVELAELNKDKKLKRAISATKEELEIREEKNAPLSPEPTDIQIKLKRGVSAKKENIEDFEMREEKIKTAEELGTEAQIKVKKPKTGTLESADVEETITKYDIQPTESDVTISSSSAKQSTLEEITIVENQESKKPVQQQKEEMLHKQISQTGKQEKLDDGKEKPQAEPIIMDTNMRDGSRPESLDVTYIVRGFANPPPVAIWTLDGKEIKPDGHLRMTASQNGEEFRLEIKKLEMKDAGVYECTLSNLMGAIKQQAVLEVTPEKDLRRPKIKEPLQDQTITKKNGVTLKAVIIGDPIPHVTWLKNGKPISNKEFEKDKIILETEDHEIEDGLKECTFSLAIPRTERSNQAKYTIKAENKWGEAESSAQLTIVLKPEIEGPEDIKVVPGEATEFTVVVQANPEPQVLWVKDNKVIEASDLISIVEDRATETYKLVFHKVLLADDGYYKVVAKNDLGETTSEARLKTIKEAEPTTEKPKFITGINDEQTADQNELTLMVRADGLPKPEIQWFNNGKEILNDDNHKIVTTTEAQVTSILTVPHFGESDVGLYKAVAKNVVGEAESKGKMSMTQTPPSISKKLDRNVDVNEGEPLELKAKFNGSPKPIATWYKDGEPISPDDENILTTILPDGTVKLNIEKCKPSDSGAYKLVVKNANGEASSLCAVAVAPRQKRPKFLKCFKDVKVPLAQELRLEAKVEAYPPPDIKWLKDGIPVRPSSNIHFETHPDGRVALVVDVMKPENAGHYELKVSNKLGEATGDATVRTEKRPIKPQFVENLFPQTVVEGFPVKMEVKAEGFPAPKITWTRNGAEIISDNKHIKIVDQPDGTSSLIIDACDEMRDALTYKAIASNEAGKAETAAPLNVQSSKKDDEPESRPMFLHALKDVITDEGQPLILEAPFTGNPIPSVDWTKDGQPIEPSERILMTCDGKKVGIRIDKAVPSDAGVYGVTITNPLGVESSQGKASVHKVFQPPSFTQRFTDLQQMPSRDAKFPCRVTGVPQPEIVWSKDGEPVRETDKYHIKRDGDLCCLYIFDCQPEDAGVYRATATNPEGEAVCTASLEVVKEIKVQKRIEPPTFLKRIGDTDLFKGMTAKFTACATGIPEPEVEWFHNDQKIYPSKRIRMDKDTNGLLRLSILGVDQDDLGKYSCRISNEHGNDICHATLKFDEGLEAKPKRPMTDQYTDFDKYKRSGAPVPISDPPIISQMTDRHCTLSWKPSIPSGPREPVTYQLEMCELPNGDWFTARTGIRTCTCGVRNLEPFRDYKFRIRVENKYGVSDPSPFAVTHRQKLEPDLPKFQPYLPPEIDFRPDTSPYFPKDFDIERPPREGMAQAPVFLRQEHPTQYGVKDQSTNMFWFVYGYPKPKITYYFNDELIEPGGRFDWSYTRNGQATLFVNKMLERDVGWYEAVARNEHGEARQRVRLEIAEAPYFIQRPDIEHVMIRGRCQFIVRVIGVPYPGIKWYRDWKPLAGSSRTKITFHEPDTCILTINDVIYKDEGLYSISARNIAGTASSSAMMYVEDNEQEYNFRTYANLSPLKPHRRLMTEYYDLGDELGRGTQGITYHAVERLNGRNYAAKVMHGKGDLRPWMYNELDILNQLRHKKLISLHDAYETDDTLGLILELGAGGELVSDYLLKMDYYTESDIAGFMRQLLQGLDYMHGKGFAHMGLNLGDLLLAHPGGDDLKITDFSLSRRISMAHLYPLAFGMPEYVSPECANNEGVGYGHDMWSVGIITYILLSGRSPFRGLNDRETLSRIREGKWMFDDEEWWSRISVEGRDFISQLLVFRHEGRMDVRAALKHPWLEKADKRYQDEFQISSKYLSEYWRYYREWMDNASCKNWFRRRPLEGAFTHPSKMVYPPGECYTPRATPPRNDKVAAIRRTWEDQLPSRSPLNYEIGAFKSESHYQNGPDTYLLQLRDVDFPVRLREYMKVASNRCPVSTFLDDNAYDRRTPIIHERRRFTDIMDEEIDDERKARINRYGAGDTPYIRRLKTELGSRLDTYVEAEAFIESKQDGRGPFFREKPQMTAMIEGKDLELTCLAVGEPTPCVQWFKNDSIIAESHRIKIFTDAEGRSHYRLTPALAFDQGMYKVVARNKVGQTITRTRILLGLIPDEPDSPEVKEVSDTEVLLTWKQPKFDGNAPVICYRLEYKLADDMEWIKKADNIDHEFYLIKGLEPGKTYIFRLAARNAIGWSDAGVPTAPVQTKVEGSSKVTLTKAMAHLQAITDSGREIEDEKPFKNDYQKETDPVVWEHSSIQEHYNFISEISRGQFSTVLKAVNKSDDDVVVAKVLEMANQKQKDDVEGEFAALRSLRHERIASLMAAYHSGDKAVFILEKLQGADVLTYLASRHEYNEQTVAIIVTQVLDGLQYLHWRGLCHLDIQPDNVVMAGVRSVQVKLVDLGSAHRVTKLGTKVPVVGHLDYIAPEVLAEEPAFPQTDIWSVGVLTYVMLSGTVPFRGSDENETKQNILFVRYRFENLYQEITQEATRFLMLLFKRQPNKRPTPEECQENRWLLPTDYMIKKRERAVFLGHRIKEYSEEYHTERESLAQSSASQFGGKAIFRSHSIQEELLSYP